MQVPGIHVRQLWPAHSSSPSCASNHYIAGMLPFGPKARLSRGGTGGLAPPPLADLAALTLRPELREVCLLGIDVADGLPADVSLRPRPVSPSTPCSRVSAISRFAFPLSPPLPPISLLPAAAFPLPSFPGITLLPLMLASMHAAPRAHATHRLAHSPPSLCNGRTQWSAPP